MEQVTERTDDGTLDPQATSVPTGRTGSDSVCAPTEHTHGAGASTASAAPARSPSERAGSPSRPRSRERDRWRDREQERSALDRSDAREPCLRRERSVALTRRDRSDRSLPSSYLRCLSKQRKQLVGGAAAVPEACPQKPGYAHAGTQPGGPGWVGSTVAGWPLTETGPSRTESRPPSSDPRA